MLQIDGLIVLRLFFWFLGFLGGAPCKIIGCVWLPRFQKFQKHLRACNMNTTFCYLGMFIQAEYLQLQPGATKNVLTKQTSLRQHAQSYTTECKMVQLRNCSSATTYDVVWCSGGCTSTFQVVYVYMIKPPSFQETQNWSIVNKT